MRRWQVKGNPQKAWTDKGPDLLRTKPNAKATIKGDLGADAGWFVRVNLGDGFGKWKGAPNGYTRAEVLAAFDGWAPKDKAVAQWGRVQRDGTGYDVAGVVRCRVFAVQDYGGTTADTDKTIALCEAGYPAGAFGGAFTCKKISGSSSYSQHAFGKAYDHSCYDANDRATDWCLRMARLNVEGDICLPVNQVLGSQNGRVGNGQNPDGDWIGPFPWREGGVDSTHAWHIHLSTGRTQSKGTPDCAKASRNAQALVLEVDADCPTYATDAESGGLLEPDDDAGPAAE